jgi:outer membrane protein OmpA-like peptidoglycan-associated protein
VISSGFGNKALDEPPGERIAPAPSVPEDERAAAALDPADAPTDFERLRELLLGNERRALDAAKARISQLETAQKELPRRLPEAAIEALRGERGNPRVADALADPVAQALGAAVQRNRQSLIDTLFPIIGPMIRKAIAEALRNLVADLNGAIESSFSVRGLKWRIEAWRGGVPYAQVVLKHRLTYRIDHVFLIEHTSGLVLQHESAPELPPLDADAIAGMLTALGDFVGDSVGQGQSDTLESMRVGEHVVWVIEGPRANLACFMRGVPPAALRTLLEQRLEEIHARTADHADEASLHSPENTEAWHALLEPMALLHAVDAQTQAPPRAPSRWPVLLALALAAFALGWFLVSRERWNTRVDAVRTQLVAHPGFVLTGIQSRPWRTLAVHGLLDPDATSLAPILAGADLGPAQTQLDVSGYLSSSDAIVARRAMRLLVPPDSVQLAVKDGVLSLDGNASDTWIAGARERAGWIAGVGRVAFAVTPEVDAVAVARAELDKIVHALPTLHVPFESNTQAAPEAESVVERIAQDVRRMTALAKTARVGLALTSVGMNDEGGSDETNARLRTARAQWLADVLAARGIAVEPGNASDAAAAAENQRSAYLRCSIRSAQP